MHIYIIYTHIYVFLLNVFLWDFNQNKDKQAFHINAFDHLQIFKNTKFHSTCSLIGKKDVCWVWVSVSVCAHALCRQHHTCYGEGVPVLKSSSSFGYALCWFSICSLARNIDGSLSASLISSWIFFFFKQLFETTTGILSIISWKFVVVCLKYNWLYTIVLTFQTALSTFILITHLCIDFSF